MSFNSTWRCDGMMMAWAVMRLYTYEEFLDEYGAEGMERWLAAVQCTPL
jgi:hypothetical protein